MTPDNEEHRTPRERQEGNTMENTLEVRVRSHHESEARAVLCRIAPTRQAVDELQELLMQRGVYNGHDQLDVDEQPSPHVQLMYDGKDGAYVEVVLVDAD